MGIPSSGFTRGVAFGDSLTKGNTAGVDSISYPIFSSAIDTSVEVVKRGVSGRTLSQLVSAFSDEVISAGCGPNLFASRNEFYDATEVNDWTAGDAASLLSQGTGASNVKNLTLTNNDASNAHTYQIVTGLDSGKTYVYTFRPTPGGTIPSITSFVGSSLGALSDILAPLATTIFETRSFSPPGTVAYMRFQNNGGGLAAYSTTAEHELRENIFPEFVFIPAGINDVSGGATSAAMIINRDLLIADAIANGIHPIIGTITPWASASSPQNTIISDYNSSTLGLTSTTTIDLHTALKDPANPTTLNPIYNSGDGIHWNQAGQQRVAELLHDVIRPASSGRRGGMIMV